MLTAILNDPNASRSFGNLYSKTRQLENRMYSDIEVKELPDISPDHPHAAEWFTRKKSFQKLAQKLRQLPSPVNILEIGCGNGWLSHRLSSIPAANVTGIDVNTAELEQAKRLFENEHCRFIACDAHKLSMSLTFDVIIFAASIQYFSTLTEILDACLAITNPGGTIHIIDSFFYRPEEVMAAKLRTIKYYHSLGMPAMAEHYFHHTYDELKSYNPVFLPRDNFVSGIFNRSLFPWIMIKKAYKGS
ncbi:MAG TPA: class I SAM-dependent methyltransferase [Flavitalea sp.]|nr:class I SAM-dependent methyltransferase [Flavitalea sp.]